MSNVYPSNPDCIFCKIVAGDIPAYKVYECANTLAFLDVGPLSEGHTLVIPKGHWTTLDQVPAPIAAEIGLVVKRVGRSVAKVTGCAGWNVLQNNGECAGQVVPHVHFHVIPRRAGDGLGYRWSAGELDKSKAESLREAIAVTADGFADETTPPAL